MRRTLRVDAVTTAGIGENRCNMFLTNGFKLSAFFNIKWRAADKDAAAATAPV